ncbi:MAG: DUF5808 domain-containing protein [Holophagaceae bacterium]
MEPDASAPRWFSAWDLLPAGTALLLALALPVLMGHLPDPVPTHFDAVGRPNGWTPKGAFPWLLFGIPGLLWGILLATGRAFAGTEQDPDGRKSEALAPLRGLMTAGVLALLALAPLGPRGLFLGLGGLGAALVLGTVLMIRAFKRLGLSGGNPEHYRWGLFYVNAEDPALWVPKRFGLGWTLNFAHAASWWILLLLLSPVAVVLGLTWMARH